jgi:phospholipid/cholesterol/gamma-HCH transport system substrate-binding protein
VKSPVTVAGVRIGRVAEIRYDPASYQALVVMNIDGRYDTLPTDTSASILTSGLLGEQYIELEPGGAEDHLKSGSRIQLTQSAMVLEKLIGRVMTTLIDKPADARK